MLKPLSFSKEVPVSGIESAKIKEYSENSISYSQIYTFRQNTDAYTHHKLFYKM